MKLSTRARYGVKALLDLAFHNGEGPILLKDVAQRQQISPMYLVHLINPLVVAGIIGSIRGAKGGIWLAKSPAAVKLSEVVQLLEGSIAPVECINNSECCSLSSTCAARDVWGELKKAMDGILESTTLQDLVERQKRKWQSPEEMYYI